MGKTLLLSTLLFLIAAIPSAAQSTTKKIKGQYAAVQIEKFDMAPQVDMSNERLTVLMLEVAEELYKIKKFSQIVEPGKQLPAAAKDARSVKVSGTVTDYYSLLPDGSPKLMGSELVGHIKVNVVFSDAATNEKLFEKEIARRVVAGPYQLTFHALTQRVAKEIAERAKKVFF